MTATEGVVLALALGSVGVSGARWLRVAQREHYLPGSVARFQLLWMIRRPENAVLWVVGLGSAVSAGWAVVAGAAAAVLNALLPLGLSPRGRTSRLRWTWRLRRLAVASGALLGAWLGLGGWVFGLVAAAVLATPFVAVLVDLATLVTVPLERRLQRPFLTRARRRLAEVAPVVVAITGSYGKTSTKEHAATLLGARFAVLASPASFNNAMGLARTVNEHLVDGTEVLVAEMGAYGPGEIEAMRSWLGPRVGVITAIGPVHLERFGSLEATLAAKAEILRGVEVAVLNVDDPRLLALAGGLGPGIRVVACSATDRGADVWVDGSGEQLEVRVGGEPVGSVPPEAGDATNVACAIGVAVALGLGPDDLRRGLGGLRRAGHRREAVRGAAGAVVIDDTYNANPAGAAAALALLREVDGDGRRVVVTPGMVEMGRAQRSANERFAQEAATVADEVVVVGRTNRAALRAGAARGTARVSEVATREGAVELLRDRGVGPGDVVLFENDLPDHYP